MYVYVFTNILHINIRSCISFKYLCIYIYREREMARTIIYADMRTHATLLDL